MDSHHFKTLAADEKFENLMKMWKHIRLSPKKENKNIENALKILHLPYNPFGAEQIEAHGLYGKDPKGEKLFQKLYLPSPSLQIVEEQSAQVPVFVHGLPGVGKTTMAFQLTHIALDNQRGILGFPVYFPSNSHQDINNITKIIAHTLMIYLAIAPNEFLGLKQGTRQSIVRLWIKFIDEGNALFAKLREVGLPEKGDGASMAKEIRRLMDGIKKLPLLSDQECLDLLHQSIPSENGTMQIFLDVQDKEFNNNAVEQLAQLAKLLSNYSIYLVSLFSGPPEDLEKLKYLYPNLHYEEIDWRKYLKSLLQRRLRAVNEDSISTWCDLEVKYNITNVDDSFINVLDGTPASLIRMGNQILSKIGISGSKLSKRDFDELVGNQE